MVKSYFIVEARLCEKNVVNLLNRQKFRYGSDGVDACISLMEFRFRTGVQRLRYNSFTFSIDNSFKLIYH
jgi:hypothetical protein